MSCKVQYKCAGDRYAVASVCRDIATEADGAPLPGVPPRRVAACLRPLWRGTARS